MIGQETKIDRRTMLTGAGVTVLVPVTANDTKPTTTKSAAAKPTTMMSFSHGNC